MGGVDDWKQTLALLTSQMDDKMKPNWNKTFRKIFPTKLWTFEVW